MRAELLATFAFSLFENDLIGSASSSLLRANVRTVSMETHRSRDMLSSARKAGRVRFKPVEKEREREGGGGIPLRGSVRTVAMETRRRYDMRSSARRNRSKPVERERLNPPDAFAL